MVESTAQPNYDVSFEMKKHFNPQELTGKKHTVKSHDVNLELQHAFKLYDVDKNGTMNSGEFKQVLKDLGKREVTDDQVKTMLKEHDKDGDKQISWPEFLEVWLQIDVNDAVDVQAVKGQQQGSVL